MMGKGQSTEAPSRRMWLASLIPPERVNPSADWKFWLRIFLPYPMAEGAGTVDVGKGKVNDDERWVR